MTIKQAKDLLNRIKELTKQGKHIQAKYLYQLLEYKK